MKSRLKKSSRLPLTMIGIALLTISCNPATVKDPIDVTFVNFDQGFTKTGPVNFNYQVRDRELVGAFTGTTTIGNVEDLRGTYACIYIRPFGSMILPTLKKGHDDYWNWKETKNN